MGRKKNRKKSGRPSTPQPSKHPNERQAPPPPPPRPPDDTTSGVSPNYLFDKESKTVTIHRADTLIAGDVHHHHHHHHHESESPQEQEEEMEVEAKIKPTTEEEIPQENGASAGGRATRILKKVQDLIANFHSVERWQENEQVCRVSRELSTLFREQGHASLTKVRFDSVHFFVRVKLGPDHDAFLRACTDGTLSRGLTKLLVTPELEEAAGVKLTVTLDLKEISRIDDTIVDDSADTSFKRLQELTPTDVKNWLVQDEDIPLSIANELEEEGINGKLLARYDGRDLREDFQLSTGMMRRIIYARDDRLKASEHANSTTSKRSYDEPHRHQENDPVTHSRHAKILGSLVEEDSAVNAGGSGKAMPADMQGITGQHDWKEDKEVGPEKVLGGVGQDISSHLPCTKEDESTGVLQNIRSLDDGIIATPEHEYSLSAEGSTGESHNSRGNDSRRIVKNEVIRGQQNEDDDNNIGESLEKQGIKESEDWKRGQAGQHETSVSGVGHDIPHSLPLTKEEESAEEAKLRFLLTGDENGSLDSSFHPILVVNKPTLGGSEMDDLNSLHENLDFVSLVNWNAVFDCNAKSLMNGICSMVESKREIKLLLPETFRTDTSTEELEFNDVPSWIFANGREDLEELQNPSLASDWNEKYGADVDRAVDFFATSAIPKERAVIVFLILSGDNIQIMSDIFKKLQSSLQGRGTFTFIAENRELYQIWADEVKKWLPKDQLDKRSFIGKDWKRINYYIKKQYGQVAVAPAELPFSAGKSCILPEKIRGVFHQLKSISILKINFKAESVLA